MRKILVPQYKDEESYCSQGQHEPIISEDLFYKVQDIVNGRRKAIRPKVETIIGLPLQGFLKCPLCSRLLTGSKSKGRTKYYANYHFSKGCNNRFGSESVNELFIKELQQYAPRKEYKKVYTTLIFEAYKEQTKDKQLEKARLTNQNDDYQNRLSKARDMLMTNQIDALDYRDIKSDYGSKLLQLQARFAGLNTDNDNIESLLNSGIESLFRLHTTYEYTQFVACRDLIGSIYPENLIYDGTGFRTKRVNEAV